MGCGLASTSPCILIPSIQPLHRSHIVRFFAFDISSLYQSADVPSLQRSIQLTFLCHWQAHFFHHSLVPFFFQCCLFLFIFQLLFFPVSLLIFFTSRFIWHARSPARFDTSACCTQHWFRFGRVWGQWEQKVVSMWITSESKWEGKKPRWMLLNNYVARNGISAISPYTLTLTSRSIRLINRASVAHQLFLRVTPIRLCGRIQVQFLFLFTSSCSFCPFLRWSCPRTGKIK